MTATTALAWLQCKAAVREAAAPCCLAPASSLPQVLKTTEDDTPGDTPAQSQQRSLHCGTA